MGTARPLRFGFTLDGRLADSTDCADMTVTYLGAFSRKKAEADARRRFEEWRRSPSTLNRHWSADQVVLG
ncbi:conserved hypothetical protein [Candidatus Terasakiella magnetica]|nr:conserved hypothetical protein [Candidatus Terasakiella magnetica]